MQFCQPSGCYNGFFFLMLSHSYFFNFKAEKCQHARICLKKLTFGGFLYLAVRACIKTCHNLVSQVVTGDSLLK